MLNNTSKHRIAFIIPYFGKFPDYFNFWLKTAGYNIDIDFLIFTNDQRDFNYPRNVKVHYISFEEMKAYIQQKFPFKISLEHPYKLCDFKLAYGYIFEEYLKSYDFWGHCDLDVIWGNIRHFLTDEILCKYDKILELGHCELYRNNEKINKKFMSDNTPFISYKEVLSTNASFCFDEKTSPMNRNLWNNEKTYSNNNVFFNACYNNYWGYFKDVNTKKLGILHWNKGELSFKHKDSTKIDILYAHFQYRNPKIFVDENYDCFLFTPAGFLPEEKSTSFKPSFLHYNIKAKKNVIKIFVYKTLYALGFNRNFKRLFIIPSRFTYKKHWKGKFLK